MKHYIKKTYAAAACATLLAMLPAAATAQVEGSALNYMLQRPRVAKFYKHKHPFDHLFVDAGAGFNLLGSGDMKPGATASVAIGDWLSPEHGVRLAADGGLWRIGDAKVKFATVSLDYLLNITAIAQPGNSYRQMPVELYGIAGAEYSLSRNNGRNGHGLGAHIGARGQFAMSPFTYFYIEPRLSLMQAGASQAATWHGFRPVGTVLLGFGYRLPDATHTTGAAAKATERHGFADGLFVTTMGGMAFAFNGHPSTWNDHIGMRAAAGVGKWFGSVNGVRLMLNATTMRLPDTHRLKAIGTQLDYMLNLNNAFGGRNERRVFWVNAVAGASYNYSTEQRYSARYSWGVGGGLQANLRLSDAVSLTVEPRLDMYNRRWMPSVNSYRSYDAAATLMAGLTYTYNAAKARAAHSGEARGLMHNSSIGLSGGISVPAAYYDSWHSYMPTARISYTHWTAPLQGWRYALQGMIGRSTGSKRYAQATVSADWMTDLTALTYGCDASRPLALRTVIGGSIGAAYRTGHTRLATDLHAGIQAALRLSPSLSVTAEPQLGYNFSPLWKGSRSRRIQPQVQIGLEYSLKRSKAAAGLHDKPAKPDFVSASIGSGAYTGNVSTAAPAERYTFAADAAYGHWFSHLNGIQAGISNTVVQHRGRRHNQSLTALHADYMLNVKSAITGEPTDDKLLQVNATAGALLGISSERGRDTRLAPGLRGAVQAGLRLSPSVEIYIEPSATVYTKKIEAPHSTHPADGELRLSIGTKLHF